MTQKEEESYGDSQSYDFKVGLAEMLTGGVIIEVTTPDQAKIAEDAGATAVTVSEFDSQKHQEPPSVLRMPHPETIQKIQEAITIPIIAKCRVGHFAEAQILESLFVDFIDECESLSPADEEHYIDKHNFRIPFICGCADLGQALRRIAEGAALLRTNVSHNENVLSYTVRYLRGIRTGLRIVSMMDHAELLAEATRINAPYDLLENLAETGKLIVPICASGGIVTPADAALMIQLGAESVFVDADIFNSADPLQDAKAIIGAVTFHRDPEMLTKASLGDVSGMKEDVHPNRKEELLSNRGW
ncbi:MAG: pyridoxal 5'-phosphate synthase lyase subunit PdxS [Chlamydiales bacterium]